MIKNKTSITYLPLEIMYIIARNIAEADNNKDYLVRAAIKAFTYNQDNYEGEFRGFIIRYEQAIYEEFIGDSHTLNIEF